MRKPFLYLTAFTTGLVVMAIELTAARLLAPFFGTSLFVWTNLIGVVLAALSLGYWLGGRQADRYDRESLRRRLYGTILIAAVLTCAAPFLVKPLFRLIAGTVSWSSLSFFWPSLLSVIALFAPPMILLGLTTPMTARLCLKSVEEGGRTFGTVYGLSTAGSILGTFLPVLVTIPWLGSRKSFFLFGAVLILLGSLGLKKRSALALLLLPSAAFFKGGVLNSGPQTLFEGESPYHYVRVEETVPGYRVLKVNEGFGAQSVFKEGEVLTGNYWDGAALLPALRPAEGGEFLILGLGGGSSARVLHHFFPSLRLTGVEIDPLLVDLGRRYFELTETGVTAVIADARPFLEASTKTYDFVMVDVFRDNQVIPFHLATREFFELVRSRLTRRGGMVMNLSAEARSRELASILLRTIAGVFPHVYELRASPYNTLIYAFVEPLDTGMAELSQVPAVGEGEIATDDRSRLDLLSARAVFWTVP